MILRIRVLRAPQLYILTHDLRRIPAPKAEDRGLVKPLNHALNPEPKYPFANFCHSGKAITIHKQELGLSYSPSAGVA